MAKHRSSKSSRGGFNHDEDVGRSSRGNKPTHRLKWHRDPSERSQDGEKIPWEIFGAAWPSKTRTHCYNVKLDDDIVVGYVNKKGQVILFNMNKFKMSVVDNTGEMDPDVNDDEDPE